MEKKNKITKEEFEALYKNSRTKTFNYNKGNVIVTLGDFSYIEDLTDGGYIVSRVEPKGKEAVNIHRPEKKKFKSYYEKK